LGRIARRKNGVYSRR